MSSPIVNDIDMLREAYRVASLNSTDPSTQNGAILVRSGNIVASGANGLPDGVASTAERWKRPLKYQFVEHAERNAIFHAARRGVATQGTMMFCPWFACADCGRAIIQAGIREVVGHDFDLHKTRPDWQESIAVAMAMFAEAGVTVRLVPGKIGDVKIRFNGSVVEP